MAIYYAWDQYETSGQSWKACWSVRPCRRSHPCRPNNRTADVSMTLGFYTTSISHLSKSWYNRMQCMVDTQGFRCLSNCANQKTERLMMLGSEFCCWAPHTCQVPSKFDQQYFLVVVIWQPVKMQKLIRVHLFHDNPITELTESERKEDSFAENQF